VAFEATLLEATDADLLLHVVDCANPQVDEQMAEVERVLAEIGADPIPQVLVCNQIDRLEATQRPRVMRDHVELPSGRRVVRVFVSAMTGEGLDGLRELLKEAVIGGADDTLKRVDAASPPAAMPAGDFSEPVGDRSEIRPTGTYHSRA